MQFQADILGVPVVRPAITESTALGAAFLAGLAVGFWKDLHTISDLPGEAHRFSPRMPQSQVDQLRRRWNEAVSRTRDWEHSSSPNSNARK
jgi:glycerol kinase